MFRRFAVLVLLCPLWSCAWAAEDVSRDPPAIYRERLAPLLTPAADAMKLADDFVDRDDASVSLLFETVRWVDAKGGSCRVLHRIDRARNEQGVARLSKDEIPYRKDEQKIHLVLARVVQPDGTSQDIAPNAAFLQSPQRDGDASIFTDYAELVTLYPNIRPGTLRESIIVIDEPTGRIPDHFTTQLNFAAYWPQARVRHVIDIDKSLADRLAITNLGSVPEPERKTVAGATRLTWLSERIAKTRFEPMRAPAEQVGPMVYLTTLKDWNAFGKWYATLLQGRDKAQGPLADLIAARTKDLKGTEDLVAALLTEAAREVRYTGIEFGIAGFQPQDPNQVWTNRYGDCKDKANLLRAMLREKNVPAYLALVNTEHAGRVEKRSPDYRHFNHAILAVPLAGGKYLFCDPTIKYARPGMLRPDDTDRDMLLIKDASTEFVHTPTQAASLMHYEFDLKMAANGSLSGWLTIDTDGLRGAQALEYFAATQQRELLRDRALSVVQGYYRGAQLIDVDAMPPEKWTGVYRLRAYFMVPGAGSAERGRDTVAFPFSDAILPNFSDFKTRQTTYWNDPEHREIHCRIQLPDGWSAVELPRPFQVESAPVGASARWEAQGSTLSASFELNEHQSVVPAEEFPLLFNAFTSLRVWLGKPLQIALTRAGPTTTATQPAAATQPELPDFPLMSSGEGQLELVDRRFPLEAGPALRREALQKVLQWFPEEPQTQFVANLRLLEMELKTDPKNPAILERARNMVQRAGSGVDLNYVSWGEYALAIWQADAGLKAEALAVLTRQAADARLTPFRRGWAAVAAARILGDDERDKAIAILDASLSLDATSLPAQYAALADLLLKNKQPDILRQRLTAIVQGSPQRAGAVVTALTQHAEQLRALDRPADAAALVSMLDELIAARPELAHLRDPLAQLKQRLGSQSALQEIAASLKAYLGEHRPAWWAATPWDDNIKTREQFRSAIQKSGAQQALEPYARSILEYLTRLAPDPQDFQQQLTGLANVLAGRNREPELVEHLLSALDQLPETDPWKHEARLVRAFVLLQKKDDAGALATYQSILQSPYSAGPTRASALRNRGEIFERRHDYPETLTAYKELEKDLSTNPRSINSMLRAIYINLERGDADEAARILAVLARLSPRELNASESAAQIRDLLELSQDKDRAAAFWKRQELWWPLWLELEKKLDFPPLGDQLIVPVIFDLVAAARELGQATRANDRPRIYLILRMVAHAARWQPRYVPEVGSLYGQLSKLSPNNTAATRRMILASLHGFENPDPQIMRAVRVQLAVHLIDSGSSAEALEAVHAYRAVANPSDGIDRIMHRLWALAATRTRSPETAAATLALEADLASQDPFTDRAFTVRSLAEMYRLAGRSGDESRLLKAELENPAVKADAAALDDLRQRYQSLQAVGTSGQFAVALDRWMHDFKPSWYDLAPPRDLSDYASQNLDDLIGNPPPSLSAVEHAKICLLIAQAPIQPGPRRVSALHKAAYVLSALLPTREARQKLFASIYNDPQFPADLRGYVLLDAAGNAAVLGDDVGSFTRNDLYASASAAGRAWLDSRVTVGKFPSQSAGELEKALTALFDATFGPNEQYEFWSGYYRLLQLDPAAGRRVFSAGARAKLPADSKMTVAALRVQMLKALTLAERNAVANRALRDLVLARFPVADFPAPDAYQELRFEDHADWLDHPTRLAALLQRARDSRWGVGGIPFWRILAAELLREDPDAGFRLSMLATILKNTQDDAQLAALIADVDSFYDADVPAQRDAAAEIVKPLRNPDKFPLADAAVRLMEIKARFRNGTAMDLDAAFKGLTSQPAKDLQARLQLTQCVIRKDAAAAKTLLASMATESIIDAARLLETLPALELAGMNDEAALLRESGNARLASYVLRSWTGLRASDIHHTLALASALNAPQRIPTEWYNDIMAQVHNAELRSTLAMRWADLRGDWGSVPPAADALLKDHPRQYAAYWYKGRALFQLGRKPEAAEALKVYLQYAHNELHYPKAADLLDQIQRP